MRCSRTSATWCAACSGSKRPSTRAWIICSDPWCSPRLGVPRVHQQASHGNQHRGPSGGSSSAYPASSPSTSEVPARGPRRRSQPQRRKCRQGPLHQRSCPGRPASVRSAWWCSVTVQALVIVRAIAGSAGCSESFQSPWPYATSAVPGRKPSRARARRAPGGCAPSRPLPPARPRPVYQRTVSSSRMRHQPPGGTGRRPGSASAARRRAAAPSGSARHRGGSRTPAARCRRCSAQRTSSSSRSRASACRSSASSSSSGPCATSRVPRRRRCTARDPRGDEEVHEGIADQPRAGSRPAPRPRRRLHPPAAAVTVGPPAIGSL